MTDVTQTKRPERWHLGDAVVARLIDGACSGECCMLSRSSTCDGRTRAGRSIRWRSWRTRRRSGRARDSG